VFIAHGTRDGLIPVTHAERLFAAAAKPKRLFSMIDYPHIDLPCDAFYPTLRDFLAECERPAN
jgi:abhydrolase domain-containing protein 17